MRQLPVCVHPISPTEVFHKLLYPSRRLGHKDLILALLKAATKHSIHEFPITASAGQGKACSQNSQAPPWWLTFMYPVVHSSSHAEAVSLMETGGNGGHREERRHRGGEADESRWLLRNRTRSPAAETAKPRPKTKARPIPRTCTTSETRFLRPPLPRHSSTGSSARDGERANKGTTSPSTSGAGSSTDRPTTRPADNAGGEEGLANMNEEHAVDAWRFLLGMDPESFEAGVDIVAAGQPLLPQYVSEMITETTAMYSDQDRATMTLAFLRFLRLLMSEVSQAFERGVQAGQARNRDEVLVDVVADPLPENTGDGASFMQRTLNFQRALNNQHPAVRNANIQGLQARISRGGALGDKRLEELQAVLVAMTEPGDSTQAVGDVAWQLGWWNHLFEQSGCEVSSSSTDRMQVTNSFRTCRSKKGP